MSNYKVKELNIKVLELSKTGDITIQNGAYIKGKWQVFNHPASYNLKTQTLSVGCKRIKLEVLKSLKSRFDKDILIECIIKANTKYPKAIKTNMLLEESDKYYISTIGKAFLKSNYEIKKLSPAFPFPKSIDGNRFNVGSSGYYGTPIWKTKEQILNETDKILEIINFIEKNQSKV